MIAFGLVVCAAYLCRIWPREFVTHCRQIYLLHRCVEQLIPAGTTVYTSGPPETAVVSPPWAALAAASPMTVRWTGGQRVATVFVGERQSSDGVTRLVVVEAGFLWKPGEDRLQIETLTERLGLLTPMEARSGGAWDVSYTPVHRLSPSPDVVVQSAQPDPADPAHIWFACRLFDRLYTFDGRLRPDGTVDRKARSSAAPPPS
jgi:hypothetical protein